MKKKGKWTIYDLEKNGQPFKLLVECQEDGEIKQIIEKPNFKEIKGDLFLSGSHLVMGNPERNHLDYFQGEKKIKMEKTPNQTFNYWVSGSVFGI